MNILPDTLRRLAAVVATTLTLLLAGCGSIEVDHYTAEKPAFDLPGYFNGTVDAWGMFQKRSGEVVKRFHVRMNCQWQGDTGTLDELFTYSDGTTQRRVWTVRRTAPGRYVGTAADVVGEAEGIESGNALRWRYQLRLPVDGTEYIVNFDDWMYRLDDGTVINRASMSKFGVELGQVTLAFRKVTAP